jgi:NitT/TauT family transport system substrate-binding protein
VLQRAAQNGDQVGAFLYSDFCVDFYSNGIGAMEDYIRAKPEVTRNFVQATMSGLKFTLDHPKEAIAMLKKHQPQLDEAVALQEVDILRKLTAAESLKVLGSMTKEKMEITQNLTVKYLDLKNPEKVEDTYTNEFLA